MNLGLLFAALWNRNDRSQRRQAKSKAPRAYLNVEQLENRALPSATSHALALHHHAHHHGRSTSTALLRSASTGNLQVSASDQTSSDSSSLSSTALRTAASALTTSSSASVVTKRSPTDERMISDAATELASGV